MNERMHEFDCDPGALSRGDLLTMARCLSGDHDVTAEENYARALDQEFGADEHQVGNAMTYLIAVSSDPREHTERVLCGADLLRQSRRTQH